MKKQLLKLILLLLNFSFLRFPLSKQVQRFPLTYLRKPHSSMLKVIKQSLQFQLTYFQQITLLKGLSSKLLLLLQVECLSACNVLTNKYYHYESCILLASVNCINIGKTGRNLSLNTLVDTSIDVAVTKYNLFWLNQY